VVLPGPSRDARWHVRFPGTEMCAAWLEASEPIRVATPRLYRRPDQLTVDLAGVLQTIDGAFLMLRPPADGKKHVVIE